MKKLILIMPACIILLFFSCQRKTDEEAEKQAILQVLLNEGERFADYDLDGISALHIQDETSVRLAGVSHLIQGWNEIQDMYEGYIERNKAMSDKNPVTNARNQKENVITKVTGNTAWCVCDNVWKWEEEGETVGYSNRQITFLEKVNGLWKISFNAFICYPED